MYPRVFRGNNPHFIYLTLKKFITMLTVTSYQKRVSKEGKEFITLEIQGGLEMIQSQQTGQFYGTVRKSSVSTTFGEVVAASLVGSQIPGKIVRVEVDPYKYVIEASQEEVVLTHRWSYSPDDTKVSQLQHSF
jgi:hypothetical protein